MSFDQFLASLPWPTLGWGTLIVIVILLILKGELVPRRAHEELIELWKGAYEKQYESREKLEVSVDKLSDGMETVIRVVQALPAPKKEDGS